MKMEKNMEFCSPLFDLIVVPCSKRDPYPPSTLLSFKSLYSNTLLENLESIYWYQVFHNYMKKNISNLTVKLESNYRREEKGREERRKKLLCISF